MDTSIPLNFSILWQPLVNTAGDVRFQFDFIQKSVGDLMDTSEASVTTYETETISVGEDNVLKKTVVQFYVNDLVPGEILGFGS